MTKHTNKHYVIIIFIIFAIFIYQYEAADLRIYNALENNKILQVHCKSKDDDLGVHQLNLGEFYEFHFLPNYVFPNTLFFCGFVFDDTLHWYNIYDQVRDQERCPDSCYWTIKEPGPCLLDLGYTANCDVWNKGKLHMINDVVRNVIG
ncbi:S-protein homolog 5-like [Chenopodium quinoa]|uniref:S-protein homolog 5-like n=1 Tax=Chenopodium quinoa TaxID=63459 RepID=UPI000B789C60|nr:S-protein homolog 5-like [Chenopodium quinoa]